MTHVISPRVVVAAQRLHPRVVAIDGPAGSGKSTVGSLVATALDYLFFDTGVMYRAVTWAALAREIAIADEAAVTTLAYALALDVLPPERNGLANRVVVDGDEVSAELRRPEVDQQVSSVSAYAGVRDALSARQRAIGARYGAGGAEKPGVVMVGRDIGTVIMPDAGLKVYLDASAEVRAKRRYDELMRRQVVIPYEQVLADLLRRDELDSGRAHSPLRIPPDAHVLDTSGMTVDDVVAAVLALLIARTAAVDSTSQGHSVADDVR